MATKVKQEEINKAIEVIIQELIDQQYATTSDLVEKVGDKDICRRALTKLNRARAITKRVSEGPGGSPVDEWTFQNPDRFRGKGSLAVLEEIGKTEGTRLIYGNYMPLETKIRLTTPCLAGLPSPGEDHNLVFRRVNGKIWLMAGYFQAMFKEAARLTEGLSEGARNAAWKWTRFEDVFLDDNVEHQTLIAPEGKGIFIGEALPIGTEIPVKMLFPSTRLTAQQVMMILHTAEKVVGFSIAKHTLGWGRFVVVE